MKRAMKKAMQVIALAVLGVLVAGGAALGKAPAPDACYGDNCHCDTQRADDIAAAKLARDKGISSCTDHWCIDRVMTEYRQRLDEIEVNYRLCFSVCHIEYWIRFWL